MYDLKRKADNKACSNFQSLFFSAQSELYHLPFASKEATFVKERKTYFHTASFHLGKYLALIIIKITASSPPGKYLAIIIIQLTQRHYYSHTSRKCLSACQCGWYILDILGYSSKVVKLICKCILIFWRFLKFYISLFLISRYFPPTIVWVI